MWNSANWEHRGNNRGRDNRSAIDSTVRQQNDRPTPNQGWGGPRTNNSGYSNTQDYRQIEKRRKMDPTMQQDIDPEFYKVWPIMGITKESDLPCVEIPADWNERLDKAVAATQRFVHNELVAMAQQEKEEEDYDDSDSDCKKDDMSDDSDFEESNRIGQKERYYFRVISSLKDCVPLTYGFHSIMLYQSDDEMCWCPCGPKMKEWRRIHGVTLMDHDACNADKRYRPHPFLKHLESSEDLLHRSIRHYMQVLFKGLNHKAFCNVNSKEYRDAESAANRKKAELIRKLKVELEAASEKAKEAEAAKKQMEQLRKTNSELHNELKLMADFKSKLCIDSSKEKERKKEIISPEMQNEYSKQYIDFFTQVKFFMNTGMDSNKKELKAIKVQQNPSIQELFDRWYNGRASLLFRPFETREDSAKLLRPWTIEFEGLDEFSEIKGRERKHFKAIDEGGPSREFFSSIWNQMKALQVPYTRKIKTKVKNEENPKDPKINLKLFDETDSGYVLPVSDEVILHQVDDSCESKFKEKVGAYYRALGRVMIQCIATDDAIVDKDAMKGQRTGNTIASHALPPLYRNWLLRGKGPSDESYILGDLVEHSVSLINQRATTMEDAFRRFGVMECDDPEENERNFRSTVHMQFIENRRIALEALKEGISLNGLVNLPLCFRLMPLEIVDKILFTKASIEVEDVIQALRYKVYEEEMVADDKVDRVFAAKDKVEKEFPAMLRRCSEVDSTFIHRFVKFCTGLSYLPDITHHTDFHIAIEFNGELDQEESLPRAHTCINTLALPALGYDGNMEKLAQKLKESLQYSDIYDMN